MAGRENGTYILLIDFVSSGETNTIWIPIYNNNGKAHILVADDEDHWFPFGDAILNFEEITEKQLFEEIQKIHPYYSSCTADCNHRLIHLILDYDQHFSSIYRPIFSNEFTDDFHFASQKEAPPKEQYKDLSIINFQEYSNQLRQLEIILDDISEVFKVVAPDKKQYSVYGHNIRNIIILACTEIDERMQNILECNGVKSIGTHFQMLDYYKLKDALRLDEYELSFYRYGDFGTFAPFSTWESNTQLFWYKAYNDIKHNREKHFKKANLFNAINAIMAYAIILIAQYGYRNKLWRETVGKIIQVNKEPKWQLKDFYIKRSDNQISVPFPFK